MIFTEFRFIFFFAFVFCTYWSLSSNKLKKIFLLLCSYWFYGLWDWRFLSLIWISTIVDYIIGLSLNKTQKVSTRKFLLIASLITNLSILGFFKYFNFFISSAYGFLDFLGLSLNTNTLQFILPVGISFYTFQTLSYTIDIYRKEIKPVKIFFDFALFVAFFPQLVAGPIVRASDFLPQLNKTPKFSNVAVQSCLVLFLIGFFKKACISDNIAPVVDLVFSNPSAYNTVSLWLGTILYAIQIYCDFSGYSDMAIACAGLLGYEFCLNFSHPYLATNIGDFWRRWHISLSTWLRDYLYIPLGGNRGTKVRTYQNLMLTMILGGLWHGAAWRFVMWGFLHGFALVSYRVISAWQPFKTIIQKSEFHHLNIVNFFGTLITFYWVCLAWIFFRADSWRKAWEIAQGFVLFKSSGNERISPVYILLILGLLIAHIFSRKKVLCYWWKMMPQWGFAVIYGVIFAVVFSFKRVNYEPFIYFQF